MLESNLRRSYNIKHCEYEWKAKDGKALFAQKWDAGKNARAAILLVHGLGEHSSRYAHWAAKLVNEGISVLTFDFRGHGQTPGKPGQISDFTKLLDDIQLLVDNGNKEFPNIPKFLYGHSMGGNLVTNYVISNCTNIAGVILTSPWFELSNQLPRYKFSATLFLSKIMPWVLSNAYIKPESISRELREVYNYKNDKLIHNKISLGLFRKAHEKGQLAKRSIYRINSPLLVMHGTGDQISPLNATHDFIRNASDKTTFIEWEGGYHDLHNDIDREKVFIQLLDWLDKQIKTLNA